MCGYGMCRVVVCCVCETRWEIDVDVDGCLDQEHGRHLAMHCGQLFFFKQKTAYEMRISDWSSDVCSSDLRAETIDRVVAAVKQFRTANDAYDVDFRVKQDAALAAAEDKGEEYH